jgi:peptide/nickel transport system permease protein
MFGFLVRRLAALIATLFVTSVVIFAGVNLAPGDPAARFISAHTTHEKLEQLRAQLGLNKPLLDRYTTWIYHAVQGNFGTSYVYKQSVTSLLAPRFAITGLLVAYAAIIIFVFGISIGVIATVVKKAALPASIFSGVAFGIPSFVAATLLITAFALHLGWFPVLGDGNGFWGEVHHLTLPAVALAVSWTAYVAQITRVALTTEASREHVDTARARGLGGAWIFRRHIVRNAAIPIVGVMGLTVGGLIAGTVVVEVAFNLSGIGAFLVQSVTNKDGTVVEAISLLFVGVFVIINTGLDVIYTWLDPRVRLGSRA